MKTFKLVRLEDVSGVSGTGVVAEGVEFHDGQVVLSWYGRHHTLEVAPSIADVVEIHGHEGRTVVKWQEPEDVGETIRRTLVEYGVIDGAAEDE